MRLVSQVFSLQTINNLIVIGNALVSVQVGSKLTRYPQRNGCRPTPVLPTWISMLFCYYYLLNCTSSWRQRLPHGYLCSLLVCYTIYPIKGLTSWRLAFRFCVPQGHFIVLQFEPRCQCQEKSTSLMCRFLISFHWVGLVINVCGPFSWNARVLFNFTLSPSLKRSLKLALNNSGNQGLSIKTKLFFLLSFLLGGSSHLYFNW